MLYPCDGSSPSSVKMNMNFSACRLEIRVVNARKVFVGRFIEFIRWMRIIKIYNIYLMNDILLSTIMTGGG